MQCLICLFLPALAAASEVHPIKNVMTMIQKLDQKAQALEKEEASSFEEYQAFMDKEKNNFAKAITDFKEKTGSGETSLKAMKAKQASLEEKKASGANRLTEMSTSEAEAKTQCAEAQALNTASLKDMNATVQAVKEGLASLEAAKGQPAAAAGLAAEKTVAKSLLSQHASLLEVISKEDEATLLNLAGAADAAPTQAPVKSHTGSVTDLFKKLLVTYKDKHAKTTVEGLEAKGDCEVAQAQHTESISLAQTSQQTLEGSLAELESKISKAESELAEAKHDLETNSKSLQDTDIELKMRTDEFKERNYMRKREHEAFQYGLQLLAKVSGLKVPTASLVQLRSPDMHAVQKKVHAINLLHEAAHLTQSRELKRLASALEDGAAPVAEVGKKVDLTIQQQVWKIMDDQLGDDKKRAWCEQEVNKTAIEKKFKDDVMQEIKAKIEVAQADIAELESDIETATRGVAGAKKDMHEEAMLREKAKHENKDAVADAKDGQGALKMAMEHIQKFYDEANGAAASFLQAFLQVRKGAPSPGWSGAGYTGVSADSKGSPGETILSLLESTLTSYTTMEATVNAEEAQQQAEFETKKKDWKAIVAESETEAELKTQERFRMVEKLKGFAETQKLTDRQAASLENYLEDVTADCFSGNSTFETRAAERTAEIASLNESRETLQDAFNVTAGTQLLRAQRVARSSSGNFLAPN